MKLCIGPSQVHKLNIGPSQGNGGGLAKAIQMRLDKPSNQIKSWWLK